MMKFSERMGITPIKKIIQKEEMDESLKTAIWNCMVLFLFGRLGTYDEYGEEIRPIPLYNFCIKSWTDFFGERLNEFPDHGRDVLSSIEELFFDCEWYQIYDFIEYAINNYPYEPHGDGYDVQDLIVKLNEVLEKELSAYRVVGSTFIEVTSTEEVTSIEEALQATNEFAPVNKHLKRAIELFSDKKNPDYRNSIKESISAVEALYKIITDKDSATLGQASKRPEIKNKIPGDIRSAMEKLYVYTTNEGGIRHSLLDSKATPNSEEAKFMLVTCSAYVNYLIQKILKKDDSNA